MLDLVPYYPAVVGISLPMKLADRNLRPDLAERMVNAKVDRLIGDIDELLVVGMYSSKGEWVQGLSLNEAMRHDVLGWIHYNAGKREQGEKEIAKAIEESPKYIWALNHMGRILEAKGSTAEAKVMYTRGIAGERPTGDHPNQVALQRLHIASGGSNATFEAFLDSARAQEREGRRAAILAGRITTPKPLPAFSLEKLDGSVFESAQLAGKNVVVNFWGTWCGPCVAEAGDIQKFYDKHKDEPDFVFITISNDEDPAVVRDFMTKRRLTFPVLLDAKKYIGVKVPDQGFPTTWFIGKDGNVAFSHTVGSDQVLEEFEWRVDAVRGKSAVASEPAAPKATTFEPLPVLPVDTPLIYRGYLPPHDELPYLIKGLPLTDQELQKIDAIRREFRPRFLELMKQAKDPNVTGPQPLFDREKAEQEERAAARAALLPEHRKAFDDAVVALVNKRQSMIQVQGGE
jgi:peroxiredoxin